MIIWAISFLIQLMYNTQLNEEATVVFMFFSSMEILVETIMIVTVTVTETLEFIKRKKTIKRRRK